MSASARHVPGPFLRRCVPCCLCRPSRSAACAAGLYIRPQSRCGERDGKVLRLKRYEDYRSAENTSPTGEPQQSLRVESWTRLNEGLGNIGVYSCRVFPCRLPHGIHGKPTACRKEATAKFPFPLSRPSRLRSTTLANRLAASPITGNIPGLRQPLRSEVSEGGPGP